MDDFPFAIIALSEKETALITERGRWNQDRLDASEFPAHAVKFKYHMYGEENSIECLKSKKCLPLGGYSTWSVLGRQLNESTPFVFAVAGADSSSFFHDFVAGADADVSGVVSLLAAASALSKVADVTSLPKQIAFALFEGESWGYLGSRRFVHDIAWFQCDEYRTKEGVKMCQRPYRPSLEFTKIKLDNIDRIIEVNQIGLNNTLFMHREHDSNPATDALISDIRSAAGGIESDTLKVEAAAQDTPGVPPSSVQAFLSLDRSKPVVVLTDHKGPYTNKYYHSRFDDYQYVESDEARVLTSRLCSAATLLARSLYKSAGGSDANAKDINADCSQTISLFRCLSRNVACDLVRWYSSIRPDRSDSAAGEEPGEQEEEVPANHYTSVYQIKLRTYISGLPRFYMNWLTEVNLNATKAANAHNLHELELELEKGSAGSSPSLPSVRAQLDRNAEVEDRDFAAKMVTGVNTDYDYDVTDESDYSDDDFMLGMEQKNRLKEERLQRIELQELKEEEELCTFFHDAVDPALIYDYEHSNWKINESIPESMIWTESNWGRDLGTLSYRRESGMMESVMLAAGIIVLTAGLVLLPLSRYFCKRKFKLL